MKNTIGFKYSLIKEKRLTHDEVFTMVAIELAAEPSMKEGVFYVNYERALYITLGKMYTRSDWTRFLEAINELTKKGLFIVQDNLNNRMVLAKIPFIDTIVTRHFVILDKDEINKIFSSNVANSRMILTFYILLLSMRDGAWFLDKRVRYKVVHMSKSFIAKYTGVNIKTVSEYVQRLASLKVIAIASPKRLYSDTYRNLSCLYSSYSDLEALNIYIDLYHPGRYNILGSSFPDDFEALSDDERANRRRSYLTKYRWLKEGKTYSREEVYQIKKACEEYNRKQLAKQKENLEKDMDFYPKLKDMSVFDDYDFSDLEKMDQFKIPGVNPFA